MALRDLSIELDESLRGEVRIIHDQASLRVLMCPTASWHGVLEHLTPIATTDELASLRRLFEHPGHPRAFAVSNERLVIRDAEQPA